MKLSTPDAFWGDPYGHVTNQCAHFVVGVWLAIVAVSWSGPATPLLVGSLYLIVWEIGVQRGRLWRDSLEDTVHVTTGAAVITAALQGGYWPVVAVLVAQAGLLAVGVRRRSK